MSRRTVSATCALAVLLSLLRAAPAAAQPDPLDVDRAMARARFEADQATFAELGRQRVEAADVIRRAWMQPPPPFIDGPDIGTEALMPLLRAELDRTGEAGAGPILELVWRLTREHETKQQSKLNAGRIGVPEYLDTRIDRLEVQKLRAAQKDAGNLTGPFDDVLSKDDPLAYARRLADWSDEAARMPPAELDRERLRAARQALREREEDFQRRGSSFSLPALSDAAERWLRAELAVQGADDAGVREQAWRRALQIETMVRKMFANGRFAEADYLETRCARLEHQASLAGLDPAKRGGAPFTQAELLPGPDDPLDQLKELARRRFEMEQIPRERVLRAWRDDARRVTDMGLDYYAAGRGASDLRLDALARLTRAGLADRGEEGRAAVLEASWRLAWQVDQICQAKLQAGRISIVEAAYMRGPRLAVEMELARLRERKPEK
jgi:hypothetical protein